MTRTAKLIAAAGLAVIAVFAVGTALDRDERAPRRAGASASRPPPDAHDTDAERPASAHDSGSALDKERARRVDPRIRPEDTGLDILRRVIEGGADATNLLWDHDEARSHVRPTPGPVVRVEATGDVTPVDLSKVAADAAVIEFGPGTFRLDPSAWHWMHESLESLEVRGAGMDRTTLVPTGEDFLFVAAGLTHLRVADLTFDGGERAHFLNVRGRVGGAFENVRFLRWDARGGSGAPVGTSGGAYLLFRSCEFLGGFGDSRAGLALAIRGDTIAAFDRCLFADLDAVLAGSYGGASRPVVQMDGCSFENAALADSSDRLHGRTEYLIRVRAGQVHFGAPDLPDSERRREWGAEWAAEVTETRFSPEVPRCTLGDLIRVLDLYQPADGAVVGGIYAATARRGGTELFWLTLVKRDGASAPALVRLRDGRVEDVPPGSRSRPDGNDPVQVLRCRPLAELLRASGLPHDSGCPQADFATHDFQPVVYVGARWPPTIILDGQTGERIRLP